MAKVKCYETRASFSVSDTFREKYKIPWHDRQFKITCNTTSIKKANEIAEALGIGRNVFQPDFTYTLTAPEIVARCEEHGGFEIGTGKYEEFVSIHEALKK